MRPGLVLALLVAAPALSACGQAAEKAASSSPVMLSPVASSASEVVREIDDPHSGTHWLLMRDENHPGGPGRLVPVEEFKKAQLEKAKIDSQNVERSSPTGGNSMVANPVPASLHPIVRAGDRLIVEEHTSVLDARLEAVALAPAAAGATLNVRLKIGGKVVRALVLEPGRATLQPDSEARP